MANEAFRFLLYGDSLVAGYGLAEKDAFPARLEQALVDMGFAVEVINGGVSGDTSRGGVSRLDWMLAHPPDAVLLELGANDGLRGLAPAQTFDNLDRIMMRLTDMDIPVLLAGMRAPPNLGADYGAEFTDTFERLAEKYKDSRAFAFYPFFLQEVARRLDLNQADGLHPNAQGVAVLVETILPTVAEFLTEAGAPRPGREPFPITQ